MTNPVKEDIKNINLLFGQLWDTTAEAICLFDEDGKFLLVNDAFCKIFQLEKDRLQGKTFSVLFDQSKQNYAQTFQQEIRNNKIFECAITLWNGNKGWYEFSNSNLTLPDTKIITVCLVREISDRKNKEIELQQSEDKYKLFFNNINDAVFVTQLSGDKSYGDFIEVNEIACKRLGYTKEEFLKLSPSAILSPKSIDDFNEFNNRLHREGCVTYDIVHRAKDKKLIPVEINSHLFSYNNRLAVLSIARDITERKQTEEKLKRSSKLLRDLAVRLQTIREEERTMIAQEIHDELGQVLTALKIQISLLSNKLDKKQEYLKEKITSLMEMIDASVESVQRISAKLRPGILDELGLTAAIEWQAEEFEKMTNIKCSLALMKEDFRMEKNKSTAIFRIFQEALTNIARHSEAKNVVISLLKHQDSIFLEVRDNGKGITQEQIKDFKSLGIHGMEERAMVFGGQVYIEGLPGKGTTVIVEIPSNGMKHVS